MSSSVIFLVLVMCQPARLFAQTVLPANQSHGRTARVPFVGCASYLGRRYQEGRTSEVMARLKEVTVDPKTVVQTQKMVPNGVGVPKPVMDLTAGTWKYKIKVVQGDRTFAWTYSITIKEDGGVWTVTDTMETPDGPVTDVSTLEKKAR